MRNLDTLIFHPTSERIVEILSRKTQNENPMFFRILISYHMAKAAAMMRVKVASRDRGHIPVNMYAINLAASGQGKGYSTNIIEEQILNQFKTVFYDQTYPLIVEENLAKLAVHRAYIKNEDEDDTLKQVTSEFKDLGTLPFAFDSGTPAAIKQTRHHLLMAKIGSMNLEIDEIGSNLSGNTDILNTMLELYDIGKIKPKLVKNTKENVRNEDIDGRTPANALLYGTPNKLLDGAKIEEDFISFLDTGFARRSFFGLSRSALRNTKLTAKEIYARLVDSSMNTFIQESSDKFAKLASIVNYNKVITMSEAVSIVLIEYRMHCEELADAMPEHQEIAKAEMAHRYFKALKLAGTYAFIDGHADLTEDNLYAAIKMAEESGKAFDQIINREKPWVKLAKYIAHAGHEVTHADLADDLIFYKGSNMAKQDLMQLAIAWGHKNHVVIQRNMNSGIEFISGETIKKTDLNNLILAWSDDISDGYKNVQAPFDKLHVLTQKKYKHWITHHSINGHRDNDTMHAGFDMIVLDVDEGATIAEVDLLMKDYKYLLYTTKRHTPAAHRFRMIFPLNYHLKLDGPDFKEFMANIFEWLPFDVDSKTSQRSRKWLTNPGSYKYSKGDKLLDARLFIPKTAKNDEQKKVIQTFQSLTNMERWFVQNSDTGNRNNQLIKYALMLVDMGYAIDVVRTNVQTMNNKLKNKLSADEIDNTIMVSASKAIVKKGKV